MSSLFSTSTSTCTFGFVRKTHSQSNWIYKVGVVPHRRLPHTSILFCLSRFGFAPNRIFTAQETWKRLQSQNAAYNNVGNVVTLFLLLLHTDLHSLNSLSVPTCSDKLHTCKRYSCQRQLFRFVSFCVIFTFQLELLTGFATFKRETEFVQFPKIKWNIQNRYTISFYCVETFAAHSIIVKWVARSRHW